MVQRHNLDESIISNQHHPCTIIIDLISVVGLLPTVTDVRPFYPKLIRKFIVNLPVDLNDHGTLEYHKVHVRGQCFNVSPALINVFLKISFSTGFFVTLLSPE